MDSEQNTTFLSVLAYVGPLVIVSYFMEAGNAAVKFHVRQGMVLLAIEIVVWIASAFLWPLWMLFDLINLCVLILSVLGIVNVLNKKQEPLPVVGQFSKNVPF